MVEQNSEVTDAAEAPFVVSQLLSKLDATDNVEYGREMYRLGKEENILNLIDWLNKEASLKSGVKKDASYNDAWNHRSPNSQRSVNYAMTKKKHVQQAVTQTITFLHVQFSKEWPLMSDSK